MSLVMSEMARADGTSSKQARRKVKKKEAAYHMYDEALALALDTLSVDSMDHKAAYLAGVCHLQKRQGELAIKYLTSATTMAPYNALYRNHLGLAYVHKKEWTLAVDEYMVALEHATSTLKADVLYNLGFAQEMLGREEEALASYQHAVSSMPTHLTALNGLGNLLQKQGQVEEAHYYYKKVLGINPLHPASLYNQALAYQLQGRLIEAVGSYSKAAQLVPTHVEAHYNLGVVLLELGIYGEAVTAFYNTLILRPTMFEAWLNLGAYRAREQLPH
ncbi:tetratricopeptide repeat domain containing protein [Acanthamoeba castellanii str. Neff]|uniref:Tetratricopeptide repeat domain containing protein n=1 Tax=Acanthamoeba castellanii (strain ATCC 30010 / Neff) TaxID=1257118 RepID=L8GH59_ACACF|nr:tetratricopeptide repeat domain containing protein [Acanthamoeba castellanii str. Neff]ELR12327.1 tetratricopeptide repeat domain containing protein [Acanthamoeba castellanii str. Neff]